MKDFRDVSIAEAIGDPDCTWGLAVNTERDARKARWERRKQRKDSRRGYAR